MTQPGATVRDRSFAALGDLAYLDTATKGVLPSATAEKLAEATSQWAAGVADHSAWEAAAEEAREMCARHVGLSPDDVALVPSHVTAASMVARAWPDASVVVPEEEYRANLLPWISDRRDVRTVASPAATDVLCEAVDHETDLVAVSSIQSADGFRIDLQRLVEHAHSCGALVYVDASQSLGIDARLAGSGADFIAAVGYKWLLGGRGTAFLAVRPDQQRRFAPALLAPESSADIVDGVAYGSSYRLWDNARRFDQPQAWLDWVATATSMQLLSTFETAELDSYTTGLAQHFSGAVRGLGFDTAPSDVPSPIVAVHHPEPAALVDRLRASGVRAAARAGMIRFAFHLYNTESDVERVLIALRATSRIGNEQTSHSGTRRAHDN